jgi:flagellar biosynthesis GTPase FlhF
MTPNPELSELQLKFESMKELDFTKHVVIPLFTALGFKTDDYGGPYEEGKDIIFWEANAFEEAECGVAQVKKIKTCVSTRSESSFADLCNQLQQATEKKIPALDGFNHLPKKVLFITPYNIDTRALQSRFEKYQELKNGRVTILDGAKVAGLLISKCPHIARELLGHEAAIETTTLTNLSNDTLMRALQVSNLRQVEDFYCDLDFALGRQSNQLLSANLKQKQAASEKVRPERLPVFWEIHKFVANLTNIDLIIDTPESLALQKNNYDQIFKSDADDNFVALAHKSGKIAQSILTQIETQTGGSKTFENYYKPWKEVFSQAWIEYEEQEQKIRKTIENSKIKGRLYFALFFRLVGRLKNNEGSLNRFRIEQCFKKIRQRKDCKIIKDKELEHLFVSSSAIFRLVEIYQDFLKRYQPLRYNVKLNLDSIAGWIREKREWLASEVQKINAQKTNKTHLTHFLKEANKVLEVCDKLFACQELASLLLEPKNRESESGIIPENHQANKDPRFVIHAPISAFFDTGLKLAVFGDAGAGKTTTLQMYAKKLIEAKTTQLILFIPLASAMAIFRRRTSEYALSQSKPSELLLQGISDYVNQTGKGASISSSILLQILNSRRAVGAFLNQ